MSDKKGLDEIVGICKCLDGYFKKPAQYENQFYCPLLKPSVVKGNVAKYLCGNVGGFLVVDVGRDSLLPVFRSVYFCNAKEEKKE